MSSVIFVMFSILSVGDAWKPQPRDAYWQPVAGTDDPFYVYSAFLDHRIEATNFGKQLNSKAIRVIGMGLTEAEHGDIFCRLWLKNKRLANLKARIEFIKDHDHWEFSSLFVLCYLLDVDTSKVVNATVSVMAKKAMMNTPTNFLLIKDTRRKRKANNKIHLCVKPLHSKFDFAKDDWLIEWIEFNRMLGVSKFLMYNETISVASANVIRYYQKKKIVKLLPWNIPSATNYFVYRPHGILGAANDCLYRSMPFAEWLVMIDIDELVVPRQQHTLLELLEEGQFDSNETAALIFLNTFFYRNWEDDPSAPGKEVTARKTLRPAHPEEYYARTKYAVRAQAAISLNMHFPMELIPRVHKTTVPVDVGLLHHYRVHNEDDEYKHIPRVRDRTVLRYWGELTRRVNKQKRLFQDYQLNNLPDYQKL